MMARGRGLASLGCGAPGGRWRAGCSPCSWRSSASSSSASPPSRSRSPTRASGTPRAPRPGGRRAARRRQPASVEAAATRSPGFIGQAQSRDRVRAQLLGLDDGRRSPVPTDGSSSPPTRCHARPPCCLQDTRVLRRPALGRHRAGHGSRDGDGPVISRQTRETVGVVAVGRGSTPPCWTNLAAALPNLLTYLGIASALGVAGSLLLARRVKRQTLGLEPREITGLVEQREALLHGIKEGVLAVDLDRRITMVNDEAAHLLGIPPGRTGRRDRRRRPHRPARRHLRRRRRRRPTGSCRSAAGC